MDKNLTHILTLAFGGMLMALNLIACQGSKETVREIIRETPTRPAAKTGDGGQDSGGGDCVKNDQQQCFPIEEFSVVVRDQKTYVDILQPIIKKLELKAPRMAADLTHIAQERTWYRLPVALDALPKEIKGIAFKSEQMALQNLKAIFIDDSLYAPIKDTAQAKLILHELVMGVRLMSYQSPLDLCLAAAATELAAAGTESAWKKKRHTCYSTSSPLIPNKDISLNKEDYENIRTLTSRIFDVDNLDGEELEKWLATSGFRNRDEELYKD